MKLVVTTPRELGFTEQVSNEEIWVQASEKGLSRYPAEIDQHLLRECFCGLTGFTGSAAISVTITMNLDIGVYDYSNEYRTECSLSGSGAPWVMRHADERIIFSTT